MKRMTILGMLMTTILITQTASSANNVIEFTKVRGQIIRIELPGRSRSLCLAEVEVYSNGKNVAVGKTATQSSVLGNGGSGAVASRAVDGGRDGNYRGKSVSHSEREANPWWEVNLGRTVTIDKIIVYNRSGKAGARLDGFTLKILDNRKKEVFSKTKIPQADKIAFMQKKLGPIWFIGDSITQSNADGDSNGSPRKALYDLLKTNGYSFSYTGHSNKNTDGLPADDSYIYHSGISGVKIAGVTGKLNVIWNHGRVAKVKPEIILIMLGTNDIGSGQIDGTPKRLRALLDKIYTLPGIGTPKVFLASIPPNRRKEAQRTDVIMFNEAIEQLVADYKREKKKDVHFVDQFQALDDEFETMMRPDKLHPNGKGNVAMGQQWFNAIEEALISEGTGQGEMLFPGTRTVIKYAPEYYFYQFIVPHGDNGVSVSVIPPKKAAPGKPWLWRNIFYRSNTGQSLKTDLALVDEGYHVVVVYGDVTGHPRGNAKIKAVYDYLTTKYGFSKTFSASCMSRGGFMVFTYASAYPEQIESIFMDNACANALSWPAGKPYAGHLGYKGNGSKASFQMYLDAYDEFSTFKGAVEYFKTKGSPIHMLEPLAKAGVPILSICGRTDHAVPYEENDAVLEKRYKKLGGNITVIIEDKGHKHGTREHKKLLLDFIRKHTKR